MKIRSCERNIPDDFEQHPAAECDDIRRVRRSRGYREIGYGKAGRNELSLCSECKTAEKQSFIAVREDGVIIYNGSEELSSEELENELPKYGDPGPI